MNVRKIAAFILCVSFMLSALQFSAGAAVSAEEWGEYFEEYSKGYGNVLMNPGSDDSERNFSWYSEKGSKDCKVLVSENDDMTNPKEFSGKTVKTPEGDCVNKVTVSGLEDGKTYYYKCVCSTAESDVASFNTISGNEFTAMYVTDIHVTYNEDNYEKPLEAEAYNVHKLLECAVDKKELDLVISAGDQASYGLRTEYLSVISSPLWSSVPFALCAGNHDRKGFDYKYFNNNPNKYTKGVTSYIAEDYWYVKGDVLFLVFDSNCFSAITHRKFVENAVKQNPDVKWKVASFHHDMYGIMSDSRMEYSLETLRPIFGEICDEFGIDLVLTGHTHHYSISNAVFNSKTTDSIVGKDSITDPRGTIYMVSGSINHARLSGSDDIYDENIGYQRVSTEIIYNLLDFSEDSITISSYTTDSDTPFNTFTINKTTAKGAHPEYTEKSGKLLEAMFMEFKAFFEEFGIKVKVIFKKNEILNMQK